MRFSEIASQEELQSFLKLLMDGKWIGLHKNLKPRFQKPLRRRATMKPKKGPYATPPKPLPKPKPQPLTYQQVQNQQHKHQQDYAQALKRTLTKDRPSKMPKSLEPLPGNIISPLDKNRSGKEMQDLIKIANGEAPWKPL